MKITQVTPGLISIPPNGWGAIEKVIWNYKLQFEEMGHVCDIKYLNDVDVNNTDIIHLHVANLGIEAQKEVYHTSFHYMTIMLLDMVKILIHINKI